MHRLLVTRQPPVAPSSIVSRTNFMLTASTIWLVNPSYQSPSESASIPLTAPRGGGEAVDDVAAHAPDHLRRSDQPRAAAKMR